MCEEKNDEQMNIVNLYLNVLMSIWCLCVCIVWSHLLITNSTAQIPTQLCTHTDGNCECFVQLQNAIYCSFFKFDIQYFNLFIYSFAMHCVFSLIGYDPCVWSRCIQIWSNSLLSERITFSQNQRISCSRKIVHHNNTGQPIMNRIVAKPSS